MELGALDCDRASSGESSVFGFTAGFVGAVLGLCEASRARSGAGSVRRAASATHAECGERREEGENFEMSFHEGIFAVEACESQNGCVRRGDFMFRVFKLKNDAMK